MKLCFLPAEGCMPLVPNVALIVGGHKRYIGRKFDAAKGDYVPSDPFECEDGTPEAARCKKFVQRGECVPADAQTAKACGVEFDVKKQRSARGASGSEAVA